MDRRKHVELVKSGSVRTEANVCLNMTDRFEVIQKILTDRQFRRKRLFRIRLLAKRNVDESESLVF